MTIAPSYVTAAQAIAAYNQNHSVAAQVVQDSTANLLLYYSGLTTLQTAGKLASVTASGANATNAAQATSLAGLPGFGLAFGATLVISDSAANLLSSTHAAGLAKATSV